MKTIIGGAALAAALCSAAGAEDWAGTPYSGQQLVPGPGGNYWQPATVTVGGEGVLVACDTDPGNLTPPCAAGTTPMSEGYVPLSYFARSDAVAAMRDEFNAAVRGRDGALSRGLALAGAIDIQGPALGKDNRVGMALGSYGDQTAVGVNYSRRAGDFDFGVAASFVDNKGMAKASAGFSW